MLLHTRRSLLILLSATCLPFFSLQLQAAPSATSSPEPDLTFVTIPAGQFVMGTADLAEAKADLPDPKAASVGDEAPAHTVVFEKPFQMSQTEVTQKIWFDIMHTKPGPAKDWKVKNWQQLPVVSISWFSANEFIDKLNKQSKTLHYRLPTEAEWEYAARAGSTALRPFSKLAMDEYAWYIHSSNDEIQPVAQLAPNAWGLYDIYGNVWEWTADWYSSTTYAESSKISPQGPKTGDKKVRRGGSFHCKPHLIRPGYRDANKPDTTFSVLGFRLVAETKNTAH